MITQFYLRYYTLPAFISKRSPDEAIIGCSVVVADIYLQLSTHLLTPKG